MNSIPKVEEGVLELNYAGFLKLLESNNYGQLIIDWLNYKDFRLYLIYIFVQYDSNGSYDNLKEKCHLICNNDTELYNALFYYAGYKSITYPDVRNFLSLYFSNSKYSNLLTNNNIKLLIFWYRYMKSKNEIINQSWFEIIWKLYKKMERDKKRRI